MIHNPNRGSHLAFPYCHSVKKKEEVEDLCRLSKIQCSYQKE
jgi:hypothetical protein